MASAKGSTISIFCLHGGYVYLLTLRAYDIHQESYISYGRKAAQETPTARNVSC